MNNDIDIRNEINNYYIRLANGLTFWAPYLINQNYTQDDSIPRGVGKASAAEIKASAEYIVSLFPDIDSESLRRKLIDGSLPDKDKNYKAVDCSGFVYHIYDALYQKKFGKSLASILSVPKDHVLNGALNLAEWQSAHKLTPDEANNLSDDVPMEWVVNTFGRKPANLCRVAGLVSDYSSEPVKADQIQVGDLLHMGANSHNTPHIAIVTNIGSDSIEIAHSTRKDESQTGGITIENLKMSSVVEGTDGSRLIYGVRRLKHPQAA